MYVFLLNMIKSNRSTHWLCLPCLSDSFQIVQNTRERTFIPEGFCCAMSKSSSEFASVKLNIFPWKEKKIIEKDSFSTDSKKLVMQKGAFSGGADFEGQLPHPRILKEGKKKSKQKMMQPVP